MPTRADMADCKISQRAGANRVQFSLCGGELIVHTDRGNGFLDFFFALLRAQFLELDPGVGRNRRQHADSPELSETGREPGSGVTCELSEGSVTFPKVSGT